MIKFQQHYFFQKWTVPIEDVKMNILSENYQRYEIYRYNL